MSVKRSQRFKPIHNLAVQREDMAAQTLGRTQRALSEHNTKLSELTNYYHDYVKRFTEQAEKGMSITQVQSYQNFIAQLELAIAEQKTQIIRMTETCNSRRLDWTIQRKKSQVLEKVMTRYQNKEQQNDNRKEQRLADEFVANRYWHKKS